MASIKIEVDPALRAPQSPAAESEIPHVKLRGRPLAIARLLWISAVIVNLVSYVSGIPTAFAIASNISTATAERLAGFGLYPNFPATYLIILDTVTLSLFGFVALSIFKRRSDEPIAMVASSMLIFTAMLYTAPGYEARAPLFMVAAGAALGEVLQVVFLLMFPDGRFRPAWSWVWLPLLYLWRFLAWYFDYLPNLYAMTRTGEHYPFLPQNPYDLTFLLAVYVFGVWAQVRRYRRYSTNLQRQQTKWLVWGVSITILTVGIYSIAVNVLPVFQQASQDGVLMRLVGRTVRQAALCVIPITLLYSMLRHHLWDVDILINRTLVYVPLTSILAGIFAVTMAITQRIFISATGQGSEMAAVITTLVITSVFAPIKGEIEGFVDRRFKEAPDPFKRLNEFDRQVRTVVDVLDVEHLLRRLLDETLQSVRCTGGAVFLAKDGELQLVHASTGWEGPTVREFQMNHDDTCVGWLVLGSRRNAAAYSEQECKRLQQSADKVAHAIVLLMAEDRVIRTHPCPPTISVSWPPAPLETSAKAK